MGPGDGAIAHVLLERYGIAAGSFDAAHGGIDPLASKWVARTGSGDAYFLKLTPQVDQARLRVTRYLHDHGLDGVVPPLPTLGGRLSSRVGGFDLVVYPFVDGAAAIRAGLSERQWIDYGRFVRALHGVRLPMALILGLQRETFDGEAAARVRAFDGMIEAYRGRDRAWLEMAEVWRAHRTRILEVVERAEASRANVRGRPRAAELVLCHSDIHVGNVLVDGRGGLRVVDWDDLLLAPCERDLKFVFGARIGSFIVSERDTELFMGGYGAGEVDEPLLRWYRDEWQVVDIAEFAQTALVLEGADRATRAGAVDGLRTLLD